MSTLNLVYDFIAYDKVVRWHLRFVPSSPWFKFGLCCGQYGCYKEIYRVLKPGQCFAAYEWCMTDAFDPNNQEHQKIKVVHLMRIKQSPAVHFVPMF